MSYCFFNVFSNLGITLIPHRQFNQFVNMQMLMGGGGSFSAGGPGKGMHSRLCMPLSKSLLS